MTGYEMQLIDSNAPLLIRALTYEFGQVNLNITGSKTTFIPYVGFQKDFNLISQSLKKHCGGKDAGMREVQDSAIEDHISLQY